MIAIGDDCASERIILHSVYSSVIGLFLVVITVLAIVRYWRQNKGDIFRIFATISLNRIPSSKKKS